MKQALIVSTTRVKALKPKLITTVKTISFADVAEGRDYVAKNKQHVFHVQLVERED